MPREDYDMKLMFFCEIRNSMLSGSNEFRKQHTYSCFSIAFRPGFSLRITWPVAVSTRSRKPSPPGGFPARSWHRKSPTFSSLPVGLLTTIGVSINDVTQRTWRLMYSEVMTSMKMRACKSERSNTRWFWSLAPSI